VDFWQDFAEVKAKIRRNAVAFQRSLTKTSAKDCQKDACKGL